MGARAVVWCAGCRGAFLRRTIVSCVAQPVRVYASMRVRLCRARYLPNNFLRFPFACRSARASSAVPTWMLSFAGLLRGSVKYKALGLRALRRFVSS